MNDKKKTVPQNVIRIYTGMPEGPRKDEIGRIFGLNNPLNKTNERLSFELPQINRDQQVWLGQSIVALIGINLPAYFSDSSNKEDIALMLIDVLKHFEISIEDVYKYDLLENKLDPDFDYKLEVSLSYKILEKTQS